MPPRYAYWTILIDQKPTAFRAREREELLPTFHQLRRKNSDVAMKWFARGRLWESPAEAQASERAPKPPRERRGRDWRPGGEHRDPRDRFNKPPQADGARFEAPRDRPKPGARRNSRPWGDRPKSGPPHGERPWRDNPKSGSPRGDRPWGAKPTGQWRDRDRPAGKPAWRDKKFETRRPPSAKASAAGRRFSEGGSGEGAKAGRPAQKKPWQRDRPSERREAEPPPKRKDESPTKPPVAEQVVIKPEPPERG